VSVLIVTEDFSFVVDISQDAMHLTAEQESGILEMRRLYLSALGLLAKDQSPGLTSLQV
jgi:hypothetical protein